MLDELNGVLPRFAWAKVEPGLLGVDEMWCGTAGIVEILFNRSENFWEGVVSVGYTVLFESGDSESFHATANRVRNFLTELLASLAYGLLPARSAT